MTEQERLDIIDCLQHQHSLLGVDKERIRELIRAVKKINCITPLDEETKRLLRAAVNKCCDVVNYEISEDTNYSRTPTFIEKRRAIMYHVYKLFDENSYIYNELGSIFGKDRTTVYAHVMAAPNLVDTNDAMFLQFYNKLTNADITLEKDSL